jgi:hypothetical protein
MNANDATHQIDGFDDGIIGFKSGGRPPHFTTLRAVRALSFIEPAFGVWRPSAAFSARPFPEEIKYLFPKKLLTSYFKTFPGIRAAP